MASGQFEDASTQLAFVVRAPTRLRVCSSPGERSPDTMPSARSWRTLALRIAAVLAVVGTAGFYYHYSIAPSEAQRLRHRRPSIIEWEKARRPFWDGLAFVPLSDRDGIRRHVCSAIEGSSLLERLTKTQRENLAQVMTNAFYALGASSPGEYIERIAPLRQLRSSPGDDVHLLLSFKMLTHRPLPADLSSREALEVFWRESARLGPRCNEGSIGDSRGIVFSLSEWDGKSREQWQDDTNWTETWANEASMSFVRTTIPSTAFEDLVAQHALILRLGANLVLRDANKHCVPVYLGFAWDPREAGWTFQDAFMQTDERFFWPI